MKTCASIMIASALLAPAAGAELITVGFAGEVTALETENGLPLEIEFAIAEPVTGTFTFDDTTLLSGGTSNRGEFLGAIVDLQITIGDYELSWGPLWYGQPAGHMLETNDDNFNGPFRGDHIRLREIGVSGATVDGGIPQALSMELSDGENLVFPDNASTQSLAPTFAFGEFEIGSVFLAFTDPLQGGSGGGACVGCEEPRLGNLRITLDEVFLVPEPGCAGDVDGDSDTDVFDFADLAANFGAGPDATREMGDLTGDGLVDVFDFAELAADFGCVTP